MKNVKPSISKKFLNELPEDLKCPDLHKVMPACEKALADCERTKYGNADQINSALGRLEDLSEAIDAAIKQCDKKKHDTCIKVFKEFPKLIKAKSGELREALEKLARAADSEDEEEDEESDDKLCSADHINRMTAAMRSSGRVLNFALAFNAKAPEQSVFMLSKKKPGEQLFKALKRLNSKEDSKELRVKLEQLACGKAMADPNDKQVLFLELEGGTPPKGLRNKGRKWTKNTPSIVFKKLKYKCGGVVVEALDEDEMGADGDGDSPATGLVAELSAARKSARAWSAALESVEQEVDKIRGAMEKVLQATDDPSLRAVYEGMETVVNRLPNLDLFKLVEAAQGNDRDRYQTAMRQTVREFGEARGLLAGSPLLSTIDENPFVKTNVAGAVGAALQEIQASLGGA